MRMRVATMSLMPVSRALSRPLGAHAQAQLADQPLRLPGALAAVRFERRLVLCDLRQAESRDVARHRGVPAFDVPVDGPLIVREVLSQPRIGRLAEPRPEALVTSLGEPLAISLRPAVDALGDTGAPGHDAVRPLDPLA